MGIDVAGLLTTYGPLGLVVVFLMTGLLVPGWTYRKLEKENDRLESALDVERQRNADLRQFLSLGQKTFTTLAEVAEERRGIPVSPAGPPGAGGPPSATVGGGG